MAYNSGGYCRQGNSSAFYYNWVFKTNASITNYNVAIMKKTILIPFILLFCFTAKSQTIKGQVLVFGTDTAVSYASVYFDGMNKGGVADVNGNFEINISGSEKAPLIVSATGYYSATIAEYLPQQFIKVYLTQKVYDLEEVTVIADGTPRKDKETIFKRAFLGTSKNALSCTIKNLDDITLIYKKKSKTLEAFCDKPILINNANLGYDITYYLDQFLLTDKSVVYEGFYFFEETPLKKEEVKKINRFRESAYLGSRMHFIRSLWNNNLDNDAYKVMNSKYLKLTADSLVIHKDSEKNLILNDKILVVVYINNSNVEYNSYLTKNKDLVYINAQGYYDPKGLGWSGYMASQRIGDLLPFDYRLP